MTNDFISNILSETATLLTIKGENPFKIKAYEKAADSIDSFENNLAEYYLSKNKFPDIESVGSSIQAFVKEIIQTGSNAFYESLKKEIPSGILALSKVQGLGSKKLGILTEHLKISSVEELVTACEGNQLAKVKGFGEKTQASILYSARFLLQNKNKFLISTALSQAEMLISGIQQINEIQQVSITGALRRAVPVLDTIELLVAPILIEKGVEILKMPPILANIKEIKDNAIEGSTLEGVPFIVTFCESDDFATQLCLTTSFGEHKDFIAPFCNRGIEYEEAIYDKAGLQYIDAELRENRNELNRAKEHSIPELLKLGDIKGVLHAHSTYSDGAHTLKQMAEACKSLGYEYLGITDHSQTAAYANGLKPERVLEQFKEIEQLNKELSPFIIFKGIESDILTDGKLDYPDELLAQFDFVIGSIHSGFQMTEAVATQRLIKAIQNPYLKILGHPTGRLLLVREGYSINHQAVIDAAAEYNVCIEINASPYRLDLDWQWIEYAVDKGVKIAINPDAHSIKGIGDIKYGVMVGRKGYLTAKNTLNALSAKEIKDWFSNQ